MELSFETIDDITVVEIAGAVDGRAGGFIMDALIGVLRKGSVKLVVDVSGVTHMKRAAIGAFVVVSKIAAHRKGAMRICGATGETADILCGVGHGYLLKLDATLEASILAHSGFHAIDGFGGSIRRAA